MRKIYSFIFLFFVPIFTFSQYCTVVGPSSIVDSNVQSVNLSGDSGSISFIGCPGITGLQDLTMNSVFLSANSNYSISIEFGTCGGNYVGKGEVWIDFNNDEVFDTNESIGTWEGIPTTISILNFAVPSGVTNGITRMRVSQQEGGALVFPLDPCASFQWGSTMDFSIELTGGIDCSGFIGNTLDDPIITNTFPYTDIHSTSLCYSNNNYVYQSPDVHYLLLPNVNSSTINVSLCGSSFDTFLSVFDTEGNSIAFNDDGSCGSQSELNFSTIGLDSVYVIVQGWGNENGEYEINVTESTLSISSLIQASAIVFPNPVKDNDFKIQGIINQSVFIYDARGNTICEVHNYNGESISTVNFENGVYFVYFLEGKFSRTVKLIINK